MAIDWNGIREDYVSCTDTMREFANRHPEVAYDTLKRHCAKEKWEDQRHSFATAKAQKVRDGNIKKAVRKETIVRDLWDKLADRTRRAIEQDETPPASALEHYANTIEKLQKGLGVRDQLDIEEQKARIAKLRRDTEANKDETEKVVISLEGVEAWAK